MAEAMSIANDIATRWGRPEWAPAAEVSDEVEAHCRDAGGNYYLLPGSGFAFVFEDGSVIINLDGQWRTEKDRTRDVWIDTLVSELTEGES